MPSYITSPKCPTCPQVADMVQDSFLNTENVHRLFTFSTPLGPSPDAKIPMFPEEFLGWVGCERSAVRVYSEKVREAKLQSKSKMFTAHFVLDGHVLCAIPHVEQAAIHGAYLI